MIRLPSPRRAALRAVMFALLAPALAIPTAARAADFEVEGYYRARFRAFDSLSLASPTNLASSEGTSAYVQHRFWLRPEILVNDKVAVYSDILALDGVYWGDQPATYSNPARNIDPDPLPPELTDGLTPPTSTNAYGAADQAPLLDITLWRAWAEVDTTIGRFTFGRVPLQWGMGVWQNDGLGWNGDYGDSADRVQWDQTFENLVFLQLAMDSNVERFVNEADDTTSYELAVGYKAETVDAGIKAQLRRTPAQSLNIFTVDAAAKAEIGTLDVAGEAIAQFGSGNFEGGANDISLSDGGGVIDAGLHLSDVTLGLEAGYASGDSDTTDQKWHTFSFDRDFNVGLVLFEQPMPVLAAATANESNGGRDTDAELLGNAVSNAMFIRPSIGYKLPWGFDVEGTFLAARAAKVPDALSNRKGYGMEGDATVRYEAIEHVDLAATFAIFVPGSDFTEFSDAQFARGTFGSTVFAGQILGQVRF